MTTENHRMGHWLECSVAGEKYNSYIPPRLPLDPPIRLEGLYNDLQKATEVLGELNGVARAVPNGALFIYMYVRKEALVSSQIEGTQSSFSDLILFENEQKPDISFDDVEEVTNYVKAMTYGLEKLSEGFPLCLRLLREVHQVLMQGVRGSSQQPGEFRRSQNWVGGTRPGNALFVPPPPEELSSILGNFETFMNETNETLPTLIKAGILHLQFETIHPFLDGNGRLGRLLIILYLIQENTLQSPVLYLSLYLKQNRGAYYRLLQEVRNQGTWETWLEFFLKGIEMTARQAVTTIEDLNELFQKDEEKIQVMGRSRLSSLSAWEYLKKVPQVTPISLAEQLSVSTPTARNALENLEKIGIVKEITGQKRDKIYIYENYLRALEAGTEPLVL